ncbi:hypothetical protein [Mycobacterium shimoidei]|uniref:EfeO-type cupredoxin-like domain-containing protein n=1 Tax=Mycobacterium shimoidei TaxID=29313 RepID=A0A1E3TDT4_MYCSH|nr:hypothetical protein [Mycobacterium shimoidei]MCV7260323.1 hypothetical protein [Mycobacterium shimoidei]ODR12587.1 hypothetical protein BHQ16_14790 [Mycobacterium shimoidei]ORW82181.1 hypothetical protein AWC26_05925 [Mycobacterium shimoidei]SRX95393.1 hypothetical protein MSP7336_03662 [Mycobacterium shimoidei]
MALRHALIAAAAAVLSYGLVACGAASNPGSTANNDAAVVVDVTIAHGSVTPTNATLEAKVHQPITVRVTSDATDELHVHSVPDHKFQVAAAPDQTFQFSVEVPGKVDVELHHLNKTIATIQVRP